MDGRFNNQYFNGEQEDCENSPENSGDSTPSAMFNDNKMTPTSSPKRSKKAVQKRVVSVPIREVEGSRLKGETSTPPSDSWAWRKYGQKPIKGSPFPRGYYRCSSSKGCPARKQVERSCVDPTMLVVTYSCDHNHPWPASRNNAPNRTHNHHNSTISTARTTVPPPDNDVIFPNQPQLEPDEKFTNLQDGSPEFGWFSDLESTSSTMLESPFLAGDNMRDAEMAMIFSRREEDESLFADLGELPECSVVLRRGMMEREEERRRCSLTPWCGTTG